MCPGYEADPRETNDLRKTAVIDCELKRLGVGIAALQETRLSGTGSLREKNYTFFWKGKAADESRLHGVGFAVHNSLLSSVEPPSGGTERILQLRLSTISGVVTVFSVYSPTLGAPEDEKDKFYSELDALVGSVPKSTTFFSLATSMPELALTTSPGPPVSAGMAWAI